MIQNKEGLLVRQLIEATGKGRISWEPTANIDEFTTSFKGKYSVTVSKTPSSDYVLRVADEEDRELLSLGQQPDQVFQSMVTPTSIHELFDLIRRTALHVDDAIEDILATLRG